MRLMKLSEKPTAFVKLKCVGELLEIVCGKVEELNIPGTQLSKLLLVSNSGL